MNRRPQLPPIDHKFKPLRASERIGDLSVEQHGMPIVLEFAQCLERISALPQTLPTQDKESLLLANFLSNTEFAEREPSIEQLNARAAEFADRGFLARNGWAIKRVQEPNMPLPTWTLVKLP